MSDLSFQLKYTIILLLIVSVGRIPVPWVHSHGWLGGQDLIEHLGSSHPDACECELVAGVHVHVFTWRDVSTAPEGINQIPARSCSDLYDRTQSVSLPSNGAEEMQHLEKSSRSLAVNDFTSDGDSHAPFNPNRFADCTFARNALDLTRSNLGVYRL